MHRFIFITISLVILSSCYKQEIQTKSDIKSLSDHINIALTPDSVEWLESSLGESSWLSSPGPNDYFIMAILSYKKEDYIKFKEKYQEENNVNMDFGLSSNFLEKYYSLLLKKNFVVVSNEKYDFKHKAFKGTAFLKPPYQNGSCFFDDSSSKVLVILFTGS